MSTPNTSSPDSSKRASGTTARGRSPNHTSTPSNSGPSNSNVARTRSVKTTTGSPLSAKGAARRPTIAGKAAAEGAEEAKAEASAAMEELREQLRKAEAASDEHQKQTYVLQSRLDEVTSEHTRLEESSHVNVEKLEAVEKEKQDALRRHRDLQIAFENDKAASMRDRETSSRREEELNDVIQRLKDSLAQREAKSTDGEGILARSASFRGRSSPGLVPDSPIRENSQNNSNSKLLLQKDKVIESLRLELAEAQIKLVELENAGGGHVQELEKMLLEARMSNAKLMEDNESYQMLLSEKTLNGDLAKTSLFESNSSQIDRSEVPLTPSTTVGSSTLADELSTVDENTDEHTRKLESELSALKDQNKALTLYINKIISRMLASETFETLFQGSSPTSEHPLKAGALPAEKPLPSAPRDSKESNSSDGKASDTAAAAPAPAASLLQRAGSLFGGRRQRPKNINPAATTEEPAQPAMQTPVSASLTVNSGTPTTGHLTAPNQDPSTAPSLPLRRSASGRGGRPASGMRGHKRSSSDWSARIVSNLGPNVGGPISPGGLGSPRSSSANFSGAANPPPLILEDQEKADSDGAAGIKSEVTSDSGYGDSIDAPGSPRSAAAAALEGRAPSVTRTNTSSSLENTRPTNSGPQAGGQNGGWFSGLSKPAPEKTQMRPLRLVQEKEADDAEKKKANRGSFMGWFQKGPENQPGPSNGMLGASPPPHFHSRTASSVHIGLGVPGEGHTRSASTMQAPTGLGVPGEGHTRSVSSLAPGTTLSPPTQGGHVRAVSSGVVALPTPPLEGGLSSEPPNEAP